MCSYVATNGWRGHGQMWKSRVERSRRTMLASISPLGIVGFLWSFPRCSEALIEVFESFGLRWWRRSLYHSRSWRTCGRSYGADWARLVHGWGGTPPSASGKRQWRWSRIRLRMLRRSMHPSSRRRNECA